MPGLAAPPAREILSPQRPTPDARLARRLSQPATHAASRTSRWILNDARSIKNLAPNAGTGAFDARLAPWALSARRGGSTLRSDGTRSRTYPNRAGRPRTPNMKRTFSPVGRASIVALMVVVTLATAAPAALEANERASSEPRARLEPAPLLEFPADPDCNSPCGTHSVRTAPPRPRTSRRRPWRLGIPRRRSSLTTGHWPPRPKANRGSPSCRHTRSEKSCACPRWQRSDLTVAFSAEITRQPAAVCELARWTSRLVQRA